MDSARLTATIEFHGVTAANEPLGETVELSLWPDGFHDTRVAGSPGEQAGPLDTAGIAALLLDSFDRDDLDRLLAHMSALRVTLAQNRVERSD